VGTRRGGVGQEEGRQFNSPFFSNEKMIDVGMSQTHGGSHNGSPTEGEDDTER